MADNVDDDEQHVGNGTSEKICYDDSDNEKEAHRGHTFRQRRLTCSTRSLMKDASAALIHTDASDNEEALSHINGDNDETTSSRDSEKRKFQFHVDDNDTHDASQHAIENHENPSHDPKKKQPKLENQDGNKDDGEQCDLCGESHHHDEDSNKGVNFNGIIGSNIRSLSPPESAPEPESRLGPRPARRNRRRSWLLHASAPPQPKCPRRRSNVLYRHPPRDNDAYGTMALIMADEDASESDLSACAGAGATTVTGTSTSTDMGGMNSAIGPLRPYSALVGSVPEWKKSHQFHHSLKDMVLPFPRDTVGTYSCHGIEPVYGSDPGDDPNSPNIKAIAKINQDRGGIAVSSRSSHTALFAAYDGHGEGGELVSQFALHEIPKRLEAHEDFKNGNYEKAFTDVFVSVNTDLGNEKDIEPLYSGCTACVALVKGETMYFSNAGDSRAVLARRKKRVDTNGNGNGQHLVVEDLSDVQYEAYDLTTDQNPDSPGEQERIEGLGGFVSPPPEEGLSARVWLDAGFSQIGLAMARSLGDHAVKSIGVIAEPVVTSHEMRDEDEFVIIATDGVWEFLSSQEAVDIVSKDLNSIGGSSLACQRLIEAAAAKWHQFEGDYRDDITAIVIKIKELWD